MTSKRALRFFNYGVFSLLFCAFGCNNSNTPSSSPVKAEQQAQEQKKLDEKKAEVEKEKAEAEEKNKENSSKEGQIAEDQKKIDQEKVVLSELNQKVEGAATANAQELKDIAELSKDPLYRMTARLTLGQNVPVLIYVLGSSLDQIHGIETEFAAINVGPRFYSKLDLDDPEKISAEFVATLNSAAKFKSFQEYVHHNGPQIKVLTIPLSSVLVRSNVELSYRQASPLQHLFTELFWIGDSPERKIDPSQPFNLEDVSFFAPYLKSCSSVTVDCLKTLLSQNYFKGLSVIEGKAQDPLSFLERQLGETSWLIGDVGYRGSFNMQHPRNSSMPMVEEITLVNTVWAIADLSYASTIADFFGVRAAFYVGQNGNEGTYLTPITFETHTASITGDKNIDLPVNIRQLHNYICTVTTCLQK